MKPAEQPDFREWLKWVVYPAFLALCHFFLLVFPGIFFAYRAQWVLYPLVLFSLVAEGALTATMDYRGQDSLQWPIIVVNSWLYGLGIYWLYRRLRRSRPAA